jgi:hypothetical protein
VHTVEAGVLMARRMSVSMTLDAVRARTKTVTRRHVDTWRSLQPGDRLTLIEKGMGLPKGAKQVVVAEVEVVDVRVETMAEVTFAEVHREGLHLEALAALAAGEASSIEEWFVAFWLKGHGYGCPVPALALGVPCRRIEWRYLDGAQ